MSLAIHLLFLVIIISERCTEGQFRGPPLVDKNPLFLDSYIPASMQIIAHYTEHMKFDLKPQSSHPTTPTPSTVPPTRPHKPGIFGPNIPPGPDAYFSRGLSYQEYVDRLLNPTDYNNYFDRYRFPIEREVRYFDENDKNLEYFFGKSLSDLIKIVGRIEDNQLEIKDVDNQVQEFSKVYDDSDVRYFFGKGQRQPPTKAYVLLLSLYDYLSKESKKLMLNKYSGYSTLVLQVLIDTSSGTSADQFKTILSKIMERREVNNPQITKRINELLKDLNEPNSYINTALRYIPPLKFSA